MHHMVARTLRVLSLLALVAAAPPAPPKAATHETVPAISATERILKAGRLRCGVIAEPLDWNKVDLHGRLLGLHVGLCNAFAVALFGRTDRLDVVTFNEEQEGFNALQQGAADIVVGLTPSIIQAARNHVHFSLPIFEDGLTFLVHKDEGIHKLADLTGHKLCYIEDTDNDHILQPALAARGIHPVAFGFQEEGEMNAAMMDRHCQATGALMSKLAEARSTFHNAQDWVFLPDMIELIPIVAATNGSDSRLGAIMDTTISLLLEAEELGITHDNIVKLGHSTDPRVQRVTGEDFIAAQSLGLPHDWTRRVLAAVGNYGEIFAAALGPQTRLNIPRGPNALWNHGGVLVPLPFQ